jgi:hypothetical protein
MTMAVLVAVLAPLMLMSGFVCLIGWRAVAAPRCTDPRPVEGDSVR